MACVKKGDRKNMKNGIDISKHQGVVDWNKLAAQHRAGTLDFVLIRAGYGGGTVDPLFEQNYAAASAAGIPVGAYWYAYWGRYTPEQEAASFLRATAGKTLPYGVYYDVEYETDIIKLSKAERTRKTLAGLAALAASGRYVGLYASTDMINNRMLYDQLRAYDIWCAQYASRNTCKLPYGIWQHSSCGSVDGINGRVDLDIAYKDYPAIVTGVLAEGKSKADKPSQGGGNVAAGEENRLPRETATYRVAGDGKADAGRLMAFCDKLALYTLGTVEVSHNCAPVGLLDLSNRLAISSVSSTVIGPATRGDLIAVLLEADSAGCRLSWQIDVGPVSTGDAAELKELAQKMCWDIEEVQ